ncbi:hypothetical protein ACRS7F_22890 [Brucella anthropi]|uniref:hypothetical protein n=1 Tax=Brucella anthropi TaxID=529 RepID=UPI001ADF5898|nr:hypothetical protein GTN27_15680 [Ochrobactrum sp. EEELCW01]
MAVVKIEKIEILTNGGFVAAITGLQADDHLLAGYIVAGSNPEMPVYWDKNGNARNQSEKANIDCKKEDVAEAIATAKLIFRL